MATPKCTHTLHNRITQLIKLFNNRSIKKCSVYGISVLFLIPGQIQLCRAIWLIIYMTCMSSCCWCNEHIQCLCGFCKAIFELVHEIDLPCLQTDWNWSLDCATIFSHCSALSNLLFTSMSRHSTYNFLTRQLAVSTAYNEDEIMIIATEIHAVK